MPKPTPPPPPQSETQMFGCEGGIFRIRAYAEIKNGALGGRL